jgi:hypothetical protein
MKEKIKNLLDRDDDLAIWFQVLCEQGRQAVEAQAWQLAKSPRRNESEVRDAMLELAHELLPDSPAGVEDPRQVLFREMGIWASRQPEGVQDRLRHGLTGDGFQEAWDSGLHDLRGYLRTACEAAMNEAA